MSQMHDSPNGAPGKGGSDKDELERLLLQGVTLHQPSVEDTHAATLPGEDDDEDTQIFQDSDVQGALGLFAEAAQDMATAGLEASLGRHFACADYCNQAAEKAAQAISLFRFGRRSPYDHDLRRLGERVGAPAEIQDEMAVLTPFHPEAFYANTPPEEADEIISAEQARSYMQSARKVVRWAKDILLRA
ncbi:MAG TPA: HEPN domain-containing protein [Ktedonobacteraceae bacterium]|jgi:HEPN domain-containing protein|nr:HEPN domain-containing protein [Ktedonobacteraceae bacterium]